MSSITFKFLFQNKHLRLRSCASWILCTCCTCCTCTCWLVLTKESERMMQGYDDRFFVPEAPDTYLCGICSLVLRDPVQIVRCGHYFCGPCFTQYRTCCTNAEPRPLPVTCPLDRRPVTPQDFHDDVGMRRIVENLPARCPSGCGFAGCAVEVEGHATIF